MFMVHARYVDPEDRDMPSRERHDDSDHYIIINMFRLIMFINPSIDIMAAKVIKAYSP